MPCNSAATIRWIQANERLVGLNSMLLADTLNRPLRDLLTALGLNPDAPLDGCNFGGAVAQNFLDYRIFPEGHGFALNDGDPIDFIGGLNRGSQVAAQTGSNIFSILQGNTPISPVFKLIDGRPCFQIPAKADNQHSSFAFRPAGVGGRYPLDFFGTFHPTSTVPVITGGKLPLPMATNHSAWFRKIAGGDSSSARFTFGYADNTVIYSSLPVARIGLLGDGAGGFRYGSVNCPDGFNGAANGNTDIDANAVQPADLVAPGTNWWHTRIKIIPALPDGTPAKWGAYHNGVLVATFTTNTNFPRGALGASHDFTRIEATFRSFDNIAGIYWHDWRVVVTDDLTLS